MLTKEHFLKMKEVRRRVGCGMMVARRALEFSDWNIDKAIKYLSENKVIFLSSN